MSWDFIGVYFEFKIQLKKINPNMQNWLFVLSVNLSIVFVISGLVYENATKWWKMLAKVTSSNVLFCPTNSPKPKDIQFTLNNDGKQREAEITYQNRFCWSTNWSVSITLRDWCTDTKVLTCSLSFSLYFLLREELYELCLLQERCKLTINWCEQCLHVAKEHKKNR